MLDELLLGGEIQETSKKNVLKAIAAQDLLQEVQTNINLYWLSTTLFIDILRMYIRIYTIFLSFQEETPQGIFEDTGLGWKYREDNKSESLFNAKN